MKFKNDWNIFIQNIEKAKSESMATNFSNNLLDFLVVAEDHRFWLHYGVDPIALLRAIFKSKFCGCREGGSTIAMQLVRTITGQYELSYKRKLKEIYLATKLTIKMDRQEILKLYLSVAYFGWNMHGIEQACNMLNLNQKALRKYEAASLIARLKYPEQRYNKTYKKINFRANYIVNRFYKLNPQER